MKRMYYIFLPALQNKLAVIRDFVLIRQTKNSFFNSKTFYYDKQTFTAIFTENIAIKIPFKVQLKEI